MLSDPISITYNTVAKSLARAAGRKIPGTKKALGGSVYTTSDGEFQVNTSSSLLADNSVRVEITLTRTTPDSDSDPFNSNWTALPNSFGFVYVVANNRYFSVVDVPLLRAALSSFVTSAVELRLMQGET